MAHVWQSGFHDRLIRNEKVFQAAVNYIHNNPIKDGLVDDVTDYPWSSYRAMFFGEDCLLRLDEFAG